MSRYALLFILLCCLPLQAEDEYIVVEEEVDEIILLRMDGYAYQRIIFIKNNTILATRMLTDGMDWSSDGEKIMLSWHDYYGRHNLMRTVKAKSFCAMHVADDPTQSNRAGPWWAMGRNMRDLKAPD